MKNSFRALEWQIMLLQIIGIFWLYMFVALTSKLYTMGKNAKMAILKFAVICFFT
jgi:hypothetical protein